jgi:hypothetical protein
MAIGCRATLLSCGIPAMGSDVEGGTAAPAAWLDGLRMTQKVPKETSPILRRWTDRRPSAGEAGGAP